MYPSVCILFPSILASYLRPPAGFLWRARRLAIPPRACGGPTPSSSTSRLVEPSAAGGSCPRPGGVQQGTFVVEPSMAGRRLPAQGGPQQFTGSIAANWKAAAGAGRRVAGGASSSSSPRWLAGTQQGPAIVERSSPPLPSSSAAPRRRQDTRKGLLRILYPAAAFRHRLGVLASAAVHGPSPREICRRCRPPLRGLSEIDADGEETERFASLRRPHRAVGSSAPPLRASGAAAHLVPRGRVPTPPRSSVLSPTLTAPCTAPAPTHSGDGREARPLGRSGSLGTIWQR